MHSLNCQGRGRRFMHHKAYLIEVTGSEGHFGDDHEARKIPELAQMQTFILRNRLPMTNFGSLRAIRTS